jgi:hypothetical protein
VLPLLPEEAETFLALLFVFLVLPFVFLVLLVKTLGALFVLVDPAVPILIHILPIMTLTGAQEKGKNGNQKTQAFHVAG